ncbi:hypothetical protein Unana1_08378 [Umbelopsis nana]
MEAGGSSQQMQSQAGFSQSGAAESPQFQIDDGMLGFAVAPKTDCEHLPHIEIIQTLDEALVRDAHCTNCRKPETWLCLSCGGVYCSRYQNNCAKIHAAEDSHPIALSLTDLSTWCYSCEEYITSSRLDTLKRSVYILKFDTLPPEGSELDVAD